MIGDSAFGERNALWAIVVGGLIAGALDLLQACILFGWDIPLAIAGGLLGRQAFQGGAGTYGLGVLLHFLSLSQQPLFTTRQAAGWVSRRSTRWCAACSLARLLKR
jgi:hypothetical protein